MTLDTKQTAADVALGAATGGMQITVRRHGGPEVLEVETGPAPQATPGTALIRHRAIGLNYIDTYFRTGLYTPPQLPFVPGSEGAGVVEAVGAGVTEVRVGDRVAYAGGSLGAYSAMRLYPAERLVKLPDVISDETAAACLLKGLTAEYLLHRTFQITQGDAILVHAAAGGVGLLLCQWATALGARVIGTVGNEQKAALARAHGCTDTILYRRDNFAEAVRELTAGRGVAVVYDSVGADTFTDSLKCLQRRGLMVSYGNASGPVAPLTVAQLQAAGSVFLTRPTLADYVVTRSELLAATERLFGVLGDGTVSVQIGQRYPLACAAEAHRALESRATSGSSLLIPAGSE